MKLSKEQVMVAKGGAAPEAQAREVAAAGAEASRDAPGRAGPA